MSPKYKDDNGDDKLTGTLEAMYECLTDSPEIVDLTFTELQRDGTCSRWFPAFVYGIAAGLVPGRDVIEDMRECDRAHAEIMSKGQLRCTWTPQGCPRSSQYLWPEAGLHPNGP